MNLLSKQTLLGLLIGLVAGAVLLSVYRSSTMPNLIPHAKQPLYWVAPMDSNYRRDKPGKSPMGMDLVPVYDTGDDAQSDVGVVKISAAVENNLGVRIAPVEARFLKNNIRTVGYVRYDEDRLVHIHPRVEGWVEELFVKAEGDQVKAGQPLYALYSPELVNAQEELVLAVNRNNHALVKSTETRLRALNLTQSFINDIKRSGQVRQHVVFYAPQNGYVDKLNIREGYFIQPGMTLMSIGQLDEVWVEAEVFAQQATQVKVGLPVTMTTDYSPGRQWQGHVDYVYPSLDAENRTLRLRLRFSNEDAFLKPNMYTSVELEPELGDALIMVPRAAVIRLGDQDRVVLAQGEGRFKSVLVRLGRQDDQFIEIVEGLSVGDDVVVSAQFLLDSESSKHSDFTRMSYVDPSSLEDYPSASVMGVINEVDTSTGRINISRDAIEKWNRPAATLDFSLDEQRSGLNVQEIKALGEGRSVHFDFEVRDGDFVIVSLMPMKPMQTSSSSRGETP